MADYYVTWSIEITDVDTPEQAARQALEIQRDPESIATVFEVWDESHPDFDWQTTNNGMPPTALVDLTEERRL